MKKTIGCLAGFSLVCTSVLSLSPASAYSVNFNGSVTIDFSSDPNFGALMGTRTLTINKLLEVPYAQDALLLSLADGDTSLPASLLLNNFFPQTVIPGLTFNSIAIASFSGSGSAVSASGDTTNFNFHFNPTDPVLGIPVVEVTDFNQNLSQCVTSSCHFTSLAPGTLSAAFGITYLGIPAIVNITSASTAFALQTTPIPEPSTLVGLLLMIGLSAFDFKRHHR